MNQSLIFVVGPPRSGTTLMLEALGLHPQVLALGEELHRFHHDLARFPHRHGEDDHFRLTARDAVTTADYVEAVTSALRVSGRRQLVVKISTLSLQVDYVLATFPTARFVQCVRDGRDTACSMEDLRRALQRDQEHPRLLGPAPDAFALWAAEHFEHPHVRAGCAWFYHVTRSYLDLQFAGADRFLRLRYEDLVSRPREILNDVMQFIGVGFAPEQQTAVDATTDKPSSSMGFSTSQASGPRLRRFERDLDPRVRVVLSPLFELPMRLMGYVGDPVASEDAVIEACVALGMNASLWQTRVAREVAWVTTQLRAFDPTKMLREPDVPGATVRPLLIDGAAYGCHADMRDGVPSVAHSWVRKQNRQYAFADRKGIWPSIAAKLDGTHTLPSLVGADELEMARAVCGRLHGLGLVGYV